MKLAGICIFEGLVVAYIFGAGVLLGFDFFFRAWLSFWLVLAISLAVAVANVLRNVALWRLAESAKGLSEVVAQMVVEQIIQSAEGPSPRPDR